MVFYTSVSSLGSICSMSVYLCLINYVCRRGLCLLLRVYVGYLLRRCRCVGYVHPYYPTEPSPFFLTHPISQAFLILFVVLRFPADAVVLTRPPKVFNSALAVNMYVCYTYVSRPLYLSSSLPALQYLDHVLSSRTQPPRPFLRYEPTLSTIFETQPAR